MLTAACVPWLGCLIWLHLCMQAKLVQTVVANYVLWPAAHFINFRFVPSQHRILYNNVVAVRPPVSSP